jgi:predicted DNA-binding transcriptional regulator AlpA
MKPTSIGEALTGHLRRTRRAETDHQIEPALLDARQGAALLGVSLRKFHALRPTLPLPVVLSSRVVRWRTAELHLFVESLAADSDRGEPVQLAAARTRKRAGAKSGASEADTEVPPASSKATRGNRQTPVPPER